MSNEKRLETKRNPKILLLIEDTSGRNGGARPLVNWAKGLGENASLVAFRRIQNINDLIVLQSVEAVIKLARDFDYILVSDNNMNIGFKVAKRSGIKFAVYCQVPYGLHALGIYGDASNNIEKFLYTVSKFIPFKLLSSRYYRFLKSADLVIANSITMNILLNFVYGIPESKILVPPIDDLQFTGSTDSKRNAILIFVGRVGDLNDYETLEAINNVSTKYNLDVNLFGSLTIARKITRRFPSFKVLTNLSDDQLAERYRESYVTVCIQKQEFFGYVPIESILCGTPAITLYYHPAISLNAEIQKYLIFSDSENIEQKLMEILNHYNDSSISIKRETILPYFSIKSSVQYLYSILLSSS